MKNQLLTMISNQKPHGGDIMAKTIREVLNQFEQDCRSPGSITQLIDQADAEIKALVDERDSLLDGVSEMVEIFQAKSPAQEEWKNDWLRRFKRLESK